MNQYHGISIYEDSKMPLRIRVTISKKELLDSFEYFKDGNGLRREATETEFRSFAYNYSLAFALYGGVVPILHGERARFDGKPMKIVAELLEPDVFGKAVAHPMFNFTFDSKLNEKIDWDGFDALSLPEVVPGFQYGPWFRAKLQSESGNSLRKLGSTRAP